MKNFRDYSWIYRWHVRNRDNKERVRRDEENARLEQKREEERIAIAVWILFLINSIKF